MDTVFNKKKSLSEESVMELELDDGRIVNCLVLDIFEVNGISYIGLMTLQGPGVREGEVFIYRYSEAPDGEPLLDNIESDEEYENVADAFDERLDELEARELGLMDDEDFEFGFDEGGEEIFEEQ